MSLFARAVGSIAIGALALAVTLVAQAPAKPHKNLMAAVKIPEAPVFFAQ